MALLKSKKLRELEDDNTNLFIKNCQLEREIIELRHQRFTRAIELEKEIIDKLRLTDSQVTELKFIFMLERAEVIGVPKDELLLTDEDVTNFFMPRES
jgi:hypothetical protein